MASAEDSSTVNGPIFRDRLRSGASSAAGSAAASSACHDCASTGRISPRSPARCGGGLLASPSYPPPGGQISIEAARSCCSAPEGAACEHPRFPPVLSRPDPPAVRIWSASISPSRLPIRSRRNSEGAPCRASGAFLRCRFDDGNPGLGQPPCPVFARPEEANRLVDHLGWAVVAHFARRFMPSSGDRTDTRPRLALAGTGGVKEMVDWILPARSASRTWRRRAACRSAISPRLPPPAGCACTSGCSISRIEQPGAAHRDGPDRWRRSPARCGFGDQSHLTRMVTRWPRRQPWRRKAASADQSNQARDGGLQHDIVEHAALRPRTRPPPPSAG